MELGGASRAGTDAPASKKANTPLHVLHVSQPVEAGVANVVRGLVEHQRGAGLRVSVACPEGPLATSVRESGAAHHAWTASRDPGPSIAREARQLRDIIRRVQPDVIHLHSAKAGLVGRLVLRGSRPSIFQPHAWSDLAATGAIAKAARAWEKWASRWTQATVVSSAYEREHGEQLNMSNGVLIPNGVDVDKFTPADRAAARVRLGIPSDEIAVVCVGRMARQKGQDLLLAAWAELKAPGASLYLVGDGPDRESIERAAARLETVRVVPGVSDPRDWFAAADLVVLPSRWEGASLVLLEAMAMGRSLVGFDVGGLATTLDNSSAAVPPEDVKALAREISRRLADADVRHVEEESNRARAVDFYPSSLSYSRLTSLTLGVV